MSTRAPVRPEAVLAAAGLVVAIGGVALLLVLADELSVAGLSWLGPAATVGIAPALASGSLCALLAGRGVLSPRSATGVAALAVLACASALVAALSWSAGFDAADAGLDASRHTSITLSSAVAAWLLGSAAIACLTAAVLPLSPSGTLRWALAILIGAVGAPIVGAALLTPATIVVASLGLLVLAVRSERQTAEPQPSAAGESAGASAAPRPVPSAPARALAWSSALAGAVAIVAALTGSAWGGWALDGTQAMQLGIGVGNLCSLPLVLSLDLVLAARRPRRAALVHLVAALAAVALVIASAAAFAGLLTGSSTQWELLMLSVGVAAVAAAVTVGGVLPGARGVRALLALAAGAAFAVTFGLLVMAAASFLAPPLAAAWAIWGARAQPLPEPVGAAA